MAGYFISLLDEYTEKLDDDMVCIGTKPVAYDIDNNFGFMGSICEVNVYVRMSTNPNVQPDIQVTGLLTIITQVAMEPDHITWSFGGASHSMPGKTNASFAAHISPVLFKYDPIKHNIDMRCSNVPEVVRVIEEILAEYGKS